MADYSQAFDYMMQDEDAQRTGAVTPDPSASHPDAVARFGINSGANPDAVSEGFYTMPVDQALQWAASYYKYYYFVEMGGYRIIAQDIANKLFSLAVNAGYAEANKIAQRAANQVLTPVAIGYLPLAVDGICGDQTVEALNKANPEDLLPAIKSYACQFYRDVAFRQKWPPRQLAALLARANR